MTSAIYAMWLRQVKKYWRSKARIIGSLGQPVLFLVAFGFGFGHIYEKAGEGNYIQFLAPGIIIMSILFTSMFTGIEVIWDRKFGFLKETLVSPVPRWKLMLGRTLGGATVSIAQGLVVFLISLAIGFRPESWVLFPLAVVFMFFIALLFTALGTAIASRMEDMQAFPIIINFLMMPLFFLSGALFPLTGLPGVLEKIVLFNPLSYGVDALRGTLSGTSYFGIGVDALVIGVGTIAVMGLGTWLFSKIEV